MNYYGTSGNDVIDQTTLNIPDFSNIFGDAGDDEIIVSKGNAIAGSGNNTIIGSTNYSTASYWNAYTSINVNLVSGIIQNGFGGIDRLTGVSNVQGTYFGGDSFLGSSKNESFWLFGINEQVFGNGGQDNVTYYMTKSTDVIFSFDTNTNTIYATRTYNGKTGTDTLKDISTITFKGSSSDNVTITNLDLLERIEKKKNYSILGIDKNYVNQICIAHITKGSIFDIYIDKINYSDFGGTPAKPMILSFMPDGAFVDNTAKVFNNNIPVVSFGRAVAAVDFNEDGISDIYINDHGQDTGTYPGSQNQVFLSSTNSTLSPSLYGIPIYPTATNHGFGCGDIDGSGNISVINTGTRYSLQPANQLLLNTGSTFINSPQKLPSFLNQTGVIGDTYTWSNLVDINRDGRSDLLFGQWNKSKNNSFDLINDGKGNFSQSTVNYFPKPDTNIAKPCVIQLCPLDIFNTGNNDLVLSVTEDGPVEKNQGYSVKYLQFLKNDGNGNFSDITNTVFPQTVIHGDVDTYTFLMPVDYNCDGFQDLLVQSSAYNSFLLLNDKNGHFKLGPVFGDAVSVDICYPNSSGIPQVVSTTNQSINFLPPSNAPIANGLAIYNNESILGNFRYFTGSALNPNILGTEYNDIFSPGFGKENFDGMDGINTVSLPGASSDYLISVNNNQISIKHKINFNIDFSVKNTQRIHFANLNKFFDTKSNQSGGETLEILNAAFGSSSLLNKKYLGIGLSLFDSSFSPTQVAQLAINTGLISAPDNISFVKAVWLNVMGTTIDSVNLNSFVGSLSNGSYSQAELLSIAASSNFNQEHLNLVGLSLSGVDYI